MCVCVCVCDGVCVCEGVCVCVFWGFFLGGGGERGAVLISFYDNHIHTLIRLFLSTFTITQERGYSYYPVHTYWEKIR